MDKVGQYIENQMSRAVDAPNMEDGELLNLLGGTGGSHVDIVLYLSDRGMLNVPLHAPFLTI